MTKIFNSEHSRRAMFCTLLSLLMWMVGIGGAAGKKSSAAQSDCENHQRPDLFGQRH